MKNEANEDGWIAISPLCHYLPWRDSPNDDPSDLEEVIYDLFPRKVITERGDGAEIIQELRAFWHFLQRVYQLLQAHQMLVVNDSKSEQVLTSEWAFCPEE
jgi:hypothetical protein